MNRFKIGYLDQGEVNRGRVKAKLTVGELVMRRYTDSVCSPVTWSNLAGQNEQYYWLEFETYKVCTPRVDLSFLSTLSFSSSAWLSLHKGPSLHNVLLLVVVVE
jgi:hypothetical protein